MVGSYGREVKEVSESRRHRVPPTSTATLHLQSQSTLSGMNVAIHIMGEALYDN